MNPLPLVVAELRRNPMGCAAVVALIAVAVALGSASSAQERALRLASSRAADRFDLVVGAAGSSTQLVLTTVYLQPAALELVSARTLLQLQEDPGVVAVAPVAVADSYGGYPVVGTTARFATNGGQLPIVDGRAFRRIDEAMIGAAVEVPLGARIRPSHGTPTDNILEAHSHDAQLTIVGRLERSGTPWDRAILVPIEALWEMHGKSGDDRATVSSRVAAPWSAVHDLLRSVTFAFHGLLVTAVLLVIVAALSARRHSVGALRALGAPPAFVFVTVWLQGALLIAAGVLVGLGLGFALAKAIGALAGAQLGFDVDATIGPPELAAAGVLLIAGTLFAAAPSLPLLRVPAARLLRLA